MMMAERLALCAPQWTAAANGNPGKRGQQRTVYEPADHGSAAKRVVDDFDLQRVLESVYVVQQHQGTFSADDPVGPEELIDQQRVLGADQPQIPRNAEPGEQLCAVLSPVFYSFGKKFLGESHYRNLAVAVLFSAMLLSPPVLIHYGKQSVSNPDYSQPSQGIQARAEPQIGAAEKSPPQSESEEQLTDVPQTYEAEMRLFEAEAKKGSADASWKLGLGYLNGIGVGKDQNKAVQWLKRAANLGDVRAQTVLSDFYFNGIVVPRDYVRAYTWASIASGGQLTENARLRALRPRMTAVQLEDANRRTAAWFSGKSKP